MLSVIDAVSVRVDRDDGRKVLDLHTVDGFTQKIGECDELHFFDGLCILRASAADCGEVRFFVADERLARGGAHFAFSDHAEESEI